jgi:putative mRNA 3-end processing factor
LGSAQVRVEHAGQVVVVSGDYKTEADSTCSPFEPVRCHTFVTESTFGLPIYRWPSEGVVFEQINQWWRKNQSEGFASVLYGYSLGKSQRALSGLDASTGPIFEHETLRPYTNAYRAQGIKLPKTRNIKKAGEDFNWKSAMILAPPGSMTAAWQAHIGEMRTAFMSGWMAVRRGRHGRGSQSGFVVSDHVDWPSLHQAIAATEAQRVLVTHGCSKQVVRFLRETGLEAHELESDWNGKAD